MQQAYASKEREGFQRRPVWVHCASGSNVTSTLARGCSSGHSLASRSSISPASVVITTSARADQLMTDAIPGLPACCLRLNLLR